MPISAPANTVKAPPRKSGPRSTPVRAASPAADTQSPYERRRDGLIGLGSLAQGICMLTQQWADAATIGQHFPPIASELAKIADENESVAKPIDFLIAVGPYGALITAVMPFALQLMANHRIIDGSRMMNQGVVPPELLETQMKAQIAAMQADALRQQQLAMAEAEAAQKAFDDLLNDRRDMMAKAAA